MQLNHPYKYDFAGACDSAQDREPHVHSNRGCNSRHVGGTAERDTCQLGGSYANSRLDLLLHSLNAQVWLGLPARSVEFHPLHPIGEPVL